MSALIVEHEALSQSFAPGFWVYMLCCADGSLYTGWSTDPGARTRTHNQGKGAKYTKSRLPVRLVFVQKLPDKPAALRREREIKALTRTQKLKLIAAWASGADG